MLIGRKNNIDILE